MTRALPIAAVVAALAVATVALVDVTNATPTSPQTPAATAPAATPPALPVITEGARLFIWYNRGDCHGAGGSGAMAPAFVDNRWRYGGSQERSSAPSPKGARRGCRPGARSSPARR